MNCSSERLIPFKKSDVFPWSSNSPEVRRLLQESDVKIMFLFESRACADVTSFVAAQLDNNCSESFTILSVCRRTKVLSSSASGDGGEEVQPRRVAGVLVGKEGLGGGCSQCPPG